MSKLAEHVDILSPTDDLIFKSLLTKDCEESKVILMDLISSIIGVKVHDVVVKNNEPAKDDIHEKQELLDLNCVIDNGELINIEMYSTRNFDLSQNNFKSLKNKSSFYGADLFSSQDMKGKSYDEMAKTYQITFSAYTVFESKNKFVRQFKLKDDDNVILTEDLVVIFIDLSELRNILNKPVNEMTSLEKWGIFLQYADDRDKRDILNQIIETKGEIAVGSTLLQSISQDEFEQARNMSRRKFQTDLEHSKIVNYRNGKADEKKNIAKNLLEHGVDLDTIAKCTGLTLEEIQSINTDQ